MHYQLIGPLVLNQNDMAYDFMILSKVDKRTPHPLLKELQQQMKSINFIEDIEHNQ